MMKNDKQDRKLLAQLAAGYMAYYANSKIDLTKLDRKVERSVEYAIGALAAIDAHLETRRAAEVQAKELDGAPFVLPHWAEWQGNVLIAKHWLTVDRPSVEHKMAAIHADGSGWTAWIHRKGRAQGSNSVSGPETGDAARVKIYNILDWGSYAPESADKAEVQVKPTPWQDRVDRFPYGPVPDDKTKKLIEHARSLHPGLARGEAEVQTKPSMPTPRANPDIIRATESYLAERSKTLNTIAGILGMLGYAIESSNSEDELERVRDAVEKLIAEHKHPAEPAEDWRNRGGEFLLVAEDTKPPR